jgi:dehydrogenase/reductase SDR family protein 1
MIPHTTAELKKIDAKEAKKNRPCSAPNISLMTSSKCVCLVTGASRGIGRGIALQLCEHGHTVYITGRTLRPVSGGEKAQTFSSLDATAADASARGGECVPVACDHSDDAAVEALFKRIAYEQKGRLDLLVNNAYAAAEVGLSGIGQNFWEKNAARDWDVTFTV